MLTFRHCSPLFSFFGQYLSYHFDTRIFGSKRVNPASTLYILSIKTPTVASMSFVCPWHGIPIGHEVTCIFESHVNVESNSHTYNSPETFHVVPFGMSIERFKYSNCYYISYLVTMEMHYDLYEKWVQLVGKHIFKFLAFKTERKYYF